MPPVHDHEIAPATQISSVKPYGCSNARRSAVYLVQNGWVANQRDIIWYEDTMSQRCRYDGRKNDPRCGECRLPSDIEYLEGYGKHG